MSIATDLSLERATTKRTATLNDLVGQRFGSLVAVTRDGSHHICQCDCGDTYRALSSVLISGRTRSCGCQRNANIAAGVSRHQMRYTSTYNVWSSMIKRCTNPNSTEYPRYGGRGITVCDEWKSFQGFFADMGPRPNDLSLDRIDTNGNYEPGNCRWASPKEQARNTRTNHLITFLGETHCLADWAERVGLHPSTLLSRLSKGWPTHRALHTPVRSTSRKAN